jgi:hypothetical protein
MTVTEANSEVSLVQRAVSLDKDQTYAFSFWARGTFDNEPDITIRPDDESGGPPFFYGPTPEQPIASVLKSDVWTFFTYSLTATALVALVQFVINCGFTSGLVLDLDDIVLRRVLCTNPASSPPKVLLARGRVRIDTRLMIYPQSILTAHCLIACWSLVPAMTTPVFHSKLSQ